MTCPASKVSRSLLKHSSFCFAGWILLKIGNWRINSTSCSRLMSGLLFVQCSGRQQLVQRPARTAELREFAALDKPPLVHHQHLPEPLCELYAVKHPIDGLAAA